MVLFSTYGELSERFKELVLKTSDGSNHREFESHTLRQKEVTFVYQKLLLFLSIAKAMAYHHALACISSPHEVWWISSDLWAVYHARARSPFARWHSVLRSVFDGTLAEQSARGSLVQARTHSRLIITRQRASFLRLDDIQHFVLVIYTPEA